MKIKKAFDICKKNKSIYISMTSEGEQWLSDGNAVYPIFELPLLNENYICKLYDINDAQRDKITFIIAKGKLKLMLMTVQRMSHSLKCGTSKSRIMAKYYYQ